MTRVPRQYPNVTVRRERDPRTARRRALLLAGCLVLAAGFVFAVRQQIVAVELGYKTEKLRREREQLIEEERHLLLALEERTSHPHLERAARELGMQPTRARQIASAPTGEDEGPAVDNGRAGAGSFVGATVAGAARR
jgi:cell division protein FtsL